MAAAVGRAHCERRRVACQPSEGDGQRGILDKVDGQQQHPPGVTPMCSIEAGEHTAQWPNIRQVVEHHRVRTDPRRADASPRRHDHSCRAPPSKGAHRTRQPQRTVGVACPGLGAAVAASVTPSQNDSGKGPRLRHAGSRVTMAV